MSEKKGLSLALQTRLLRAILDFMIRSGLSDAAIRDAFSSSLSYLSKKPASGHRTASNECRYIGNGNVSAELIRLWTRDGRYIDRDARPKPLYLSKGRNSLVTLISRLEPSVDPYKAVASMKSAGLIRKLKNGKYLPTAESVTIDRLHPLAIEHVAKSLIRLVTTVCRNTDPRHKGVPLIERYAYVPDLSRAEVAAFADFTRSQGMAYLESVDDWLEQRRVRRTFSNTARATPGGITAGVHLVAYVGDGSAQSLPSQAAKGIRRIARTGTKRPRVMEKRPTPAREARA